MITYLISIQIKYKIMKKQLEDLIICLNDKEFENFCKHYKIYEGTILLEDCKRITIKDFLNDLSNKGVKEVLSSIPLIMFQS